MSLLHRPSDLIHGIINISFPPNQRNQFPPCHLDPAEPYFEHTIAILSTTGYSSGALDLRVATDQLWTIGLITSPQAEDSALQLVGNVIFPGRGNPIVDVIHLQQVSTNGCAEICRPKFELHGTAVECRVTDEGDSVLRVQTFAKGVILLCAQSTTIFRRFTILRSAPASPVIHVKTSAYYHFVDAESGCWCFEVDDDISMIPSALPATKGLLFEPAMGTPSSGQEENASVGMLGAPLTLQTSNHDEANAVLDEDTSKEAMEDINSGLCSLRFDV